VREEESGLHRNGGGGGRQRKREEKRRHAAKKEEEMNNAAREGGGGAYLHEAMSLKKLSSGNIGDNFSWPSISDQQAPFPGSHGPQQ
jgi:hypothetical protein